jgi:uncharacterized protein (DUF983 family)
VSSNSSSGFRFPFFDVGVVFVALKLTGEISWPWLWVLVPFWGTFTVIAAVAFIGALAINRKREKALQKALNSDEFDGLDLHSNN